MKHGLFARLQGASDGRSFDEVVEVTGQQVGQHHRGQQVDGVAGLSIDLLGAARNRLGGLLIWVVLLFDDHTEPARDKEMSGLVPDMTKQHKSSVRLTCLPEAALEAVVKVCRLTLPLAAADVSGPLHTGPVDGNLTEEQAQVFGPSLQPPGRQVEWDRQGLVRKDRRQHHWFC